MSLRFPMYLIALVLALALVVAGCGNSGPLVMPDSVPADVDVDGDAPDVETAEPVGDDATVDDPVEELGENPIPESAGDEEGNG